jgi:DegV family protein with EDD domain
VHKHGGKYMKKYVIVTDSTTDLTFEYAKENELIVLPLGYNINGVEYKDYLDHRDLAIDEFYTKINSGLTSKTTQINSDEFYKAFEVLVKQGIGILGIFFSSGLSGTFNSARIAYEEILENYPDAEIKIVDSLCASLGEGLLVNYAHKALKEGKTLDENYQYIEKLKFKIAHWFTVSDMDALKRGGRISASSAFFAKTLHINPVLNVSNEGKLTARMKKVGRKSALSALVDKIAETYDPELNDIIFISHSFASDVELVKKMITDRIGVDKFYVNTIGPVIGSHTGLGTIAIFFIANER